MIDTVIVSGGKIEYDFALDFLKRNIEPEAENTICYIAADKGLEFFARCKKTPNVVIGDFDSISAEGRAYLEKLEKSCGLGEKSVEICRLKPEKDDSDTQSALKFAISKGAKRILILGAMGGRMDHFLANLELLSLAKEKGAEVILADSQNYICLIPSGTELISEECFGKYISFFPVGGEVRGLTLTGFRYPLVQYRLRVEDAGLTVSNELAEERGKVTYTEGSLLMIQSRDAEK